MTNFSYLILHILFVGETPIPKLLKKSITTQTLTPTQPLNLHFLFLPLLIINIILTCIRIMFNLHMLGINITSIAHHRTPIIVALFHVMHVVCLVISEDSALIILHAHISLFLTLILLVRINWVSQRHRRIVLWNQIMECLKTIWTSHLRIHRLKIHNAWPYTWTRTLPVYYIYHFCFISLMTFLNCLVWATLARLFFISLSALPRHFDNRLLHLLLVHYITSMFKAWALKIFN